jgi:hypothetical protein
MAVFNFVDGAPLTDEDLRTPRLMRRRGGEVVRD